MRTVTGLILAIMLVVPTQAQQQVMVECRDLATTGNYVGPNETVINGKACRPAGAPLQVVESNSKLTPAKPASVNAPAATAPAALASAPVQEKQQVPSKGFLLEDGTPVRLVLDQNLSSADAVTGQTVDFEVVDDVVVNALLVIPRGSIAWATITEAEHKRHLGRAGKLNLNIDKVRLADGEKALLRGVKEAKGGGHTGAMTGAIVATALVVWPAAPFFLFMHGKDITIPKGTQITAYVQGDVRLDESKFEKQLSVSK
jgi:hypothetical protein